MNKNFKNKNKGFTLIELLAVIVILAIIALIAVPQILNILNNVRKNAAIDSANGIIKSAENYVTTFMLQNTGAYPQEGFIFNCENGKCSIKNNLENYNIDNLTELSFKGTKPTSGTVIIDNNGDTSLSLNLNNFCVKKHFDEDTPYIDDIENCEFEQKEQLRYEASILNSSCSTLIGKEWNFEYKGQGEEIILL